MTGKPLKTTLARLNSAWQPKTRALFWLGPILILLVILTGCTSTPPGSDFAISYSSALAGGPFDGRIILLLAKDDSTEPRFQVRSGVSAIAVFGIDVEGLEAEQPVLIDGEVFGYPVQSLNQLEPGEYVVQALLHKYETFDLKTGHTVKLPMDRGEGQQWSRAPGNFYSTPRNLTIGSGGDRINVVMDLEIPAIEEPVDTKYIRHVKMQSPLLTEFWGRPMYLGAHVLLPEGFDEHPQSRYPLAVFHGHFPADFGGFRPEPPDPDLKPDFSARFGIGGYNRIVQQEAHDFYKKWTGPNFPRMLIVQIQHANPYYDDSYAVNSANLGPYGDAITFELIPFIEEQFRGIGAGWARFLYGGSTGGWEALAAQIFYPDEYNGTFAACPDPIDFRAYTVVNLYQDSNAYYTEGPFRKVLRPGHRDSLGKVDRTIRDDNHMELALATRGRSGGQYDIWQAVYSPMGEDGYPQPIWNKLTGQIDRDVARYWRENYDLSFIMKRDWELIGSKLEGKIHIYCGDMDNYYLNNAVYLAEDFLESTREPHYAGEVDYGDRAEHCWNGDQENPNHISRLRYNSMYVSKILERIKESAPPGADLMSWRY